MVAEESNAIYHLRVRTFKIRFPSECFNESDEGDSNFNMPCDICVN